MLDSGIEKTHPARSTPGLTPFLMKTILRTTAWNVRQPADTSAAEAHAG